MAEVRRVPLGHPPAGSWLPGLVSTVAVLVALAVLKPWAPAASDSAQPTANATQRVVPVATERTGAQRYDARLFGAREPDPAWELWPAGYVVQFGIAGPVRVTGQDDPDPVPGASGQLPASPSPSGAAPATQQPPTEPPLDEHLVDLGPSDHLVALGINTPRDVKVEEIILWSVEGRLPRVVPIVRLPTLWESTHFLVIAPEDPGARGQPGAWEPGKYRLDLFTTAMEVRRVDLVIRPPLD
jgi:hypothetical protein